MSESVFSFRASDDGSRLLALWQPGAERPSMTMSTVRATLAAQGLDVFFLDEDAVTRMIETCRKAEDAVEREIGQRRDGVCIVVMSKDKMDARLTLERPYGGAAVTDAMIRESLQQAGVTVGILDEAIAAALSAGEVTDVVVARGRPTQHGDHSAFVSLVPHAQDRRPQVDQHGVTDYRDLGRITGVSPGDPVMRRTPATSGVDGYDVTGAPLKAKPGKSVPYAGKLKGVVADADDPELLRSAIHGRAVQVEKGMTVEPAIDLAQVDMSTGNIDFDGSVTVLGEVLARMKIVATGDVLVHGTVAAADIHAGGQVVLLGGFKGALEDEERAGQAPSHESTIRCAGAFHARFVEYAHVESGGDILIDDHSMFSTLHAARHVVVGVGGAKGQILGGTITAIGQVTAVKYGGPSGSKTLVQVGLEPKHRAHLEHLDAEIAKLEAQHGAAEEIERLRTEAAALTLQLALADHACVSVGRTVYPGTEVRIAGKRWSSFDDHASGVFRIVEGEVQLCPQ